jgi:hypothetical protein
MAQFSSKILIGSLCFFCLIACHTVKKATLLTTEQQGIEGQVLEQMGNQMPSMGKPISKGKPYPTTVYFYQPFYANVVEEKQGNLLLKCNGILVDSLTTNALGFFKVNLPPGNYSVVVGYEGHFFASHFTQFNEVSLVKVDKGVFVKNDITINVKASY